MKLLNLSFIYFKSDEFAVNDGKRGTNTQREYFIICVEKNKHDAPSQERSRATLRPVHELC
jgi:hypothetical protein